MTPTEVTSIDARTDLGAIELRVGDTDAMTEFYERAIGLGVIERGDSGSVLGIGGIPLLRLWGDPSAPARPARTTGLFHLAILVPDRAELARAIKRVVGSGWRFTGASDHLVSEAMYLDDPEGNGIEIYRDRPREEWPVVDGVIQMATDPLDIDAILDELRHDDGLDEGMASGTILGHVHLQVDDLDKAEAFYNGVLGFDVVVRTYPGALFVSAGGYHHHIGLNTWTSRSAPPPPEGARGLRRFQVRLPDVAELDRIRERVRAEGIDAEERPEGLLVADPAKNRVLLTAQN